LITTVRSGEASAWRYSARTPATRRQKERTGAHLDGRHDGSIEDG